MRKIIELRREYLRTKSYSPRKLREEQDNHIGFIRSQIHYLIPVEKGESKKRGKREEKKQKKKGGKATRM